MSYLKNELKNRELPELLIHNDGRTVTRETWRERRAELLEKLYINSYGRTPDAPSEVRGTVEKTLTTCAGKVTHKRVIIAFDTPKGEFTFPIDLFIPNNVENPPCVIHINFRPDAYDKYCPVEEITDRGFAIAQLCHNDIIIDKHRSGFDVGLGAMYREAGAERRPDEWGKIGMWAFACSRVLDYLISSGEVDAKHVAVAGHSRLGKTALWAAAQDERFFMGISNDSGFGGAAIHKKGTGERVKDFVVGGSWCWYCENFKKFDGIEDTNTVYDQHMLLALIAPRHICVGSAETDKEADPMSEFLNCYAQNEVYGLLGLTGLVTPDEYPTADCHLADGTISYHIRKFDHYFSRKDWGYYLDYFAKKL